MDELETAASSDVTRRRVLKVVGAGAALTWAAPAVLHASARAVTVSTAPNPNCTDCGAICAGQNQCGTGGVYDYCGCTTNTEGQCFCWSNSFCSGLPVCETSADCPADQQCVPSCCPGLVCLPPCPNPDTFAETQATPDTSWRNQSHEPTAAG